MQGLNFFSPGAGGRGGGGLQLVTSYMAMSKVGLCTLTRSSDQAKITLSLGTTDSTESQSMTPAKPERTPSGGRLSCPETGLCFGVSATSVASRVA